MPHDSNPQWVYDMNKNAHLKGRRRFRADLEDLELLCAAEYEVHGLRLKSTSIQTVAIFQLLTLSVQALVRGRTTDLLWLESRTGRASRCWKLAFLFLVRFIFSDF